MIALSAIKVFLSRSEMESALQEHAGPYLVGTESEAPRRFYILSSTLTEAPAVGVISSGLGAEPRGLYMIEEARLLIGHDFSVTALDSRTGIVCFVVSLDGVFFEFIRPTEQSVVIVHELGLMKLSREGTREWELSSDVIRDFCLVGEGELKVSTIEGKISYVDIVSGKTIERPKLELIREAGPREK